MKWKQEIKVSMTFDFYPEMVYNIYIKEKEYNFL